MKRQMKLALVLVAGMFSTPLFTAQAIEKEINWQKYDNNRIAISFDGNSEPDYGHENSSSPGVVWATGDRDEWGATAASCAILAKLDMQDKLVHCSYNNFIEAPAGPDDENQCKISLEGAFERWNFENKEILFDVTKELDAAKKHLADEIMKSTEADPLYFIHSGLSEFLYQAVQIVVDNGKEETLSHLYLVSHSGFNENHTRRNDHHTWADVQELAGNRIGYAKIKDQNAKDQPNVLWSSNKDFSVWYWMRDHNDPSINWLYNRMVTSTLADISDCGMLYWLVTGDDNGSPEKFRQFIGLGVVEDFEPSEDTTVPGQKVDPDLDENNVIIFEGEDFPLSGAWEKKEDDLAWKGAYITYLGANCYNAEDPAQRLEYKFEVKQAGTYTVKWFMRQPLENATTDLSNDIWLNFPDAIQMGGSDPIDGFFKFHNRSAKDGLFAFNGQTDLHGRVPSQPWLSVKFEKAGTYTIQVSGRSQGLQIDRFVLFKSIGFEALEKLFAEAGSEPEVGDKVYTYESANFEKYTNMGGDFVDAELDPWRKVLSIGKTLQWGAAETAFTGKDGKVKLVLNTMLETDGESTYKVYVAGKLVAEVTNSRIHGTSTPDYTIEKHELTPDFIDIKNGDIIRVEFNSATNGLVPEPGNGPIDTATSRGRWKSIEVHTTEVDKQSGSIPVDVLTFEEESSSWVLWNSGNGPFFLIDNTDAADIEARGKKTLQVLGSAAAKKEWANVNLANNPVAINGFKLFPNDEWIFKFDVNVVKAGGKANMELRLPADEINKWGLTCAAAAEFIPSEVTNGWVTKEVPLVLRSGLTDATNGHVISNMLIVSDFTVDAAADCEFYLDNMSFIPAEGFTPSSIEEAKADDFAVMAQGGDLFVKSSVAQIINVYTITGQRIASTAIEADQEGVIASGLAKGIYIVNNKKIVVR